MCRVRTIVRYDLTANDIPDAHLAALAIEHDLTLVTADGDFQRSTGSAS